MSTFLQLAVRAQSECDIVGAQIAGVTNQTGELLRLVNWLIDAYTDIQNRHTTWRWLRSTFSFTTAGGTDTYGSGYTTMVDSRLGGAISRFSHWWPFDERGAANLKIYQNSGGVATERWMSFLSWGDFRAIYKRGVIPNAPPAHYTIDPQNNWVLGPKPDQGSISAGDYYVVTGEYQRSAQTLAIETDVPEMPSQFHNVIVAMAMKKYGSFEAAPDVLSRGVSWGNALMRQLEDNQLPAVALGAPLA